ncbi:MAG: UbiA-like polyprenyltransferase [Acidobacteriota bacterium]|jgi:4-hydroxybenzoate polyprenyltransferase
MSSTASRVTTWASFVKFEHTLFSLPMLYAGAVIAAGRFPDARTALLILCAGSGARTAAMGLNRIIDRHIDARNPRTVVRELPRGTMKLVEAWSVVVGGLAVYLTTCWLLSPVALKLSPIPLLAFFVYPYMKRFTPLAHYGVGLSLSFAPLGGFVAVTGSTSNATAVLWLAGFTLLWVAGFDIIYATLDIDFDRAEGLRSLPALLGRERALVIAAITHLAAVLCLAMVYRTDLSGSLAVFGIVLTAVVLAAESWLAEKVNLAFFQLNIIVGFVVFGTVWIGNRGW